MRAYDAAFGYVNAFKSHVNVGFFRGAELADPNGLLRPDGEVDAAALKRLIETAYTDVCRRVTVIDDM